MVVDEFQASLFVVVRSKQCKCLASCLWRSSAHIWSCCAAHLVSRRRLLSHLLSIRFAMQLQHSSAHAWGCRAAYLISRRLLSPPTPGGVRP
jgi:hypothetical protein